MSRNAERPVVLTIAGSDSGGGAGVQADLKTFAALGIHGTSAITCLTAQNPRRILGIEPVSPRILRQQMEAVFAELRPAAAKTGMLFSARCVRVVAEFFAQCKRLPIIVDPVMVATSGAPLVKADAVPALTKRLLPLATLVTPNIPEAQMLAGEKLADVDDLRTAARRIYERHGCAVLVKGGHLPGASEAVDILFDGRTEWLLSAPFIKGVRTHGTGCTYSAAIAAYLARGLVLVEAVKRAKEFVSQAIAGSYRVGKHTALNPRFG